jgi:hypothetical protein
VTMVHGTCQFCYQQEQYEVNVFGNKTTIFSIHSRTVSKIGIIMKARSPSDRRTARALSIPVSLLFVSR